MTYKKFVEAMVEQQAVSYINNILGEKWYALSEGVKLENDKEHGITYEVMFAANRYGAYRWEERKFSVGGALSDTGRNYISVIWEYRDGIKEIAWMENESAREELGIKEFNP